MADVTPTSGAASESEAAAAAAIVATLEAQEPTLVFTRFDHETAWLLGVQLHDAAQRDGLGVAMAVHLGEQRVFHVGLPGSTADMDSWLDRKRRVVQHFGHASYLVGRQFVARGQTFEQASGLDPVRYAAHGGVVPIVVAGVGIVGTAGVSGLPQAEDHAFVVRQLGEFLDAHGLRP